MPTKKPRIAIVIDEETHAYFEQWAKSEGRSLSNLASKIIKKAITERHTTKESDHNE